jgi:hypothetical protein
VCEDDQTLSVTYDITSSDNFHTDLTFNNLCTATPYKYGENCNLRNTLCSGPQMLLDVFVLACLWFAREGLQDAAPRA